MAKFIIEHGDVQKELRAGSIIRDYVKSLDERGIHPKISYDREDGSDPKPFDEKNLHYI